MSNRWMRLHVLARSARRHWLLLIVVGLALVTLLAGQPAFAAGTRTEVNQTVPPPTPRPPVTDQGNDNKNDNNQDAENVTDTTGTSTGDATAGVSSVLVSDQDSDGSSVTVDSVTAAVDGWMVIHADVDGSPGPVLGQTAVPAGTTDSVVVMLDPPLTAYGQLWAMLHVDAGEVGTYEFPGPDAPAMENGNIVMAPFRVTVSTANAGAAVAAEATPEATAEATSEVAPAEATAEVTPEATAEATVEAIAAVTAEVTAEATATADQAPESLPATGGESSAPLTAAVAGMALLVLAGAAFAMRRSA